MTPAKAFKGYCKSMQLADECNREARSTCYGSVCKARFFAGFAASAAHEREKVAALEKRIVELQESYDKLEADYADASDYME